MAVQAVKRDPADWVVLDEDGTEATGAAPEPETLHQRLHTNTPADGLKSRSPEPEGRETPTTAAPLPNPQPQNQPAEANSNRWFDCLCCYQQKV